MGLTLKSQDMISSIATAFDLPVANAVGVYLFDENSVGKNYAENGAKPTVIGAPIRHSQFGVKLNASNYIDTNIILSALNPLAPEYTVMAVCSNVTDLTKNIPIAVSYKNSDAAGVDVNGEGIALLANNLAAFASIKNADGSYSSGNAQTGRSGFSTKSIIIPACRYKYKYRIQASEYNSLANVAAERNSETAVVMPTKSIRIGRFGDALGGGITEANISYETEFYAVFLFNGFLSDAEMQTMRGWISSEFLASRGLSL